MKEQKKKIQLLLEEHFSQYGFKRKKLNNYIRIKDGNVIQDIGFTTTTHGERHVIYLNPVLGVIYKDVDEIMVQLREGTNSCLEMYTPMISLPIGYLMPDNDFNANNKINDTFFIYIRLLFYVAKLQKPTQTKCLTSVSLPNFLQNFFKFTVLFSINSLK